MKKIVLGLSVLFVVFGLSGCTDASKAKQALRSQGFTNIEITGYEFFECGEDDQFHTGFKATNPNGVRIKGTVCSGILKGATIRY